MALITNYTTVYTGLVDSLHEIEVRSWRNQEGEAVVLVKAGMASVTFVGPCRDLDALFSSMANAAYEPGREGVGGMKCDTFGCTRRVSRTVYWTGPLGPCVGKYCDDCAWLLVRGGDTACPPFPVAEVIPIGRRRAA